MEKPYIYLFIGWHVPELVMLQGSAQEYPDEFKYISMTHFLEHQITSSVAVPFRARQH